jgi:dimethylglycine dehydrogenase
MKPNFESYRAWLGRLLARRLPAASRVPLSQMLLPDGKLYGDLTVSALIDEHYLLLGSGAAPETHQR